MSTSGGATAVLQPSRNINDGSSGNSSGSIGIGGTNNSYHINSAIASMTVNGSSDDMYFTEPNTYVPLPTNTNTNTNTNTTTATTSAAKAAKVSRFASDSNLSVQAPTSAKNTLINSTITTTGSNSSTTHTPNPTPNPATTTTTNQTDADSATALSLRVTSKDEMSLERSKYEKKHQHHISHAPAPDAYAGADYLSRLINTSRGGTSTTAGASGATKSGGKSWGGLLSSVNANANTARGGVEVVKLGSREEDPKKRLAQSHRNAGGVYTGVGSGVSGNGGSGGSGGGSPRASTSEVQAAAAAAPVESGTVEEVEVPMGSVPVDLAAKPAKSALKGGAGSGSGTGGGTFNRYRNSRNPPALSVWDCSRNFSILTKCHQGKGEH